MKAKKRTIEDPRSFSVHDFPNVSLGIKHRLVRCFAARQSVPARVSTRRYVSLIECDSPSFYASRARARERSRARRPRKKSISPERRPKFNIFANTPRRYEQFA